MRRFPKSLAGAVVLSFTLLVATVTPTAATVPDAPYTDTSCDGYSDAVARLYVAAFGRTPEVDGFNFWLEQYSGANWNLPEMAEFFLTSTEFEERFGDPDDEGFVTQLYNNVLGRDPDAGGLAYWVAELAGGMGRSTLLLLFSESPENVERSGTEPPILGDFNTGTFAPFTCDSPDVIAVCNAYISWVRNDGLDDLEAELGADAPVGVSDAIDTLQDPDADIDDIFTAIDSIDGYVKPICRTRWDNDLEPAESNEEAVNLLFESIVAGEEAAVGGIAPDDVIAAFDPWEPLEDDPDTGAPSLSYTVGEDSFNMLLAPTVTVFCEVDGGVITSCAFGE